MWHETNPRPSRSILVVANVTAASDELLSALEAHAVQAPTVFTLIVPATTTAGGRAAARERLDIALARMRAAGLQIDGEVADSEPLVAVSEAWDPGRYDEIIVSTLPMPVSKWLHVGLAERVGALTGAPVTHVVSRTRRPAETSLVQPHGKNAMGPLSILAWGGRRDADQRRSDGPAARVER